MAREKTHDLEVTWHYVIGSRSGLKGPKKVYSLEESKKVRKSLDDDVKKYVNHIATSWYTHGALMDDT